MDSELVITTARDFLGTKFRHQGRKKYIGVDCIGLIAGVASELGFQYQDKTNYSREPKNNELKITLEKYLSPCELKKGAVALFKLDKEPQHVGIVTQYGHGLGLIHSYLQARQVVEHNLDIWWQRRLVACYSFPGV